MFIVSLLPYLIAFVVTFAALVLLSGYAFPGTNPIDYRIYATIGDNIENLGSANNTVSPSTGSDSLPLLNSSLDKTVTLVNVFQNSSIADNSTGSPVYVNTSGGPAPGNLQIPYTGLSRYHVTPEVAKLFGLDDSTYAMIVTEVEPRSPAAIAGIRGGNVTTTVTDDTVKLGGDIILSVDGNDTFLRTNDAFLNYLRNEKKVGENMSLTVLRNGQVSEVQLTVGALPRFLWYEDSDEGIKIKYPSDWEISGSESSEDMVKFFSPQNVRVGNDTAPVAGIFLITAPSDDRGLDDLATAEQRDSRSKRNLGIALTTFANLPGYESVFYDYSDGNRTLKELSAFTIKDGNIYRINFATDPSRFNDYVPLAREAIRSFQFTK